MKQKTTLLLEPQSKLVYKLLLAPVRADTKSIVVLCSVMDGATMLIPESIEPLFDN